MKICDDVKQEVPKRQDGMLSKKDVGIFKVNFLKMQEAYLTSLV